MPTPREQQRQERRRKIELEATMVAALAGAEIAIAREVARSLAAGAGMPAVSSKTIELYEPIISGHHARVAEEFGSSLSRRLPAPVARTEAEDASIKEAFSRASARQAASAALGMGQTNEVDADRSLRIAELAGREQNLSRTEVAATASSLFLTRMASLRSARALDQTQWAAETSKQIEAEHLSVESQPTKEWVSQGDHRVRPAHLEADGQTRPLSETYEVGGEQLLYPRDMSHGASIGNVIRCRCSSVINFQSILQIRGQR